MVDSLVEILKALLFDWFLWCIWGVLIGVIWLFYFFRKDK